MSFKKTLFLLLVISERTKKFIDSPKSTLKAFKKLKGNL